MNLSTRQWVALALVLGSFGFGFSAGAGVKIVNDLVRDAERCEARGGTYAWPLCYAQRTSPVDVLRE